MNTELFSKKIDLQKWLIVMLIIALLSLLLVFLRSGFTVYFFFLMLIWILIFIYWRFYKVFVFLHLIIIIVLIVIITLIGTIKTKNRSSSNADPMRLVSCYSSPSDKPTPYGDWKITMYSGPLQSSTPDYDPKSNSIKTFSLNGITDKTEKNSFYVRAELKNNGYITGYDTTMELCDENNMTAYSYSLKNNNPKSAAGENVVAQMHYFHGGKYIAHTGKYRVDVYIKDLDKKWHFVAREEGIVITE